MYQLIRTSITMNTYFYWSIRHIQNIQLFPKRTNEIAWKNVENNSKNFCTKSYQSKETVAVNKAVKQNRKWPFALRLLAILSPFGLTFVLITQWRFYKKYVKEKLYETNNWQIHIYCTLPFRFVSRCWGWLAGLKIPTFLRPWVHGLYIKTFNVNLSEAKETDLKKYPTLSDFFVRELREDARIIDKTTSLVSPCDGTVLNFGPVESHFIDQVKGKKYSLLSFLGDKKWPDENCNVNLELITNRKENLSNRLYQCVIYLAPGDYHRFHSPTEWTPKFRRHFAGQLLSVNPFIASWVPGLFTINERVVYFGNWKHGFFSLTAVGATNVGKIKIYIDDQLHTNKFRLMVNHCQDQCLTNFVPLMRGMPLGEFRMGSTIVLIFEAPINFKFNLTLGQKIYLGQSLGDVDNSQTKKII